MATYGKYQVYYEKIKTEVEKIREENGYLNLSKAFAHWYLKNTLKMDEQDIAETIIDGNGDNGIDAITVQDAEMTLYQFKFPDKGKNIDKQIDEKTVLKDISLSVKEGEVVSIIGPSGSGKSTLLRCATFLERADDGDISYCGEEVVYSQTGFAIYPEKKFIREAQQNFGLVFQNFNLFPHYSVMKNICDAPIHVQKRNKDEIAEEAKELLKKMGLADKADYYPYQLSGGQQQRIAIARALAMKPKMLFFDEPTSALDPELTAEILSVLKALAAEKMTMIIVTHEIDFARSVSDRVVFMDKGLIVEEGSPKDVIDNPKNERTKTFLKKMQAEL